MKHSFFMVLLFLNQVHAMSCDVVVSSNSNEKIEVPRLNSEQKYLESITLLQAALRTGGDQTRQLLSHLRMLSRLEIEAATKLLAENAQISVSAQTQNDSQAMVEQTRTLLQQLRSRQLPESKGLFKFGKTETMQTAASKVDQNVAQLESRASFVTERNEKLVTNISQTAFQMRQLAAEILLLNRIIAKTLELSEAKQSESVELTHYVLGARDYLELLGRQFESLKEQSETMTKELELIRVEKNELSHFLSVQLPMLRPQTLISKPKIQDLAVKRELQLTPEIMKDGFRRIMVGDRVRLLTATDAMSGKRAFSLSINEATVQSIESSENAVAVLSANSSGFVSKVSGYKRRKIHPTESTWGLFTTDNGGDHTKLNLVVAANSEIEIGKFKINDFITTQLWNEDKPILRSASQFYHQSGISLFKSSPVDYRKTANSRLKLQILGTAYLKNERFVAVSGGFENLVDGIINDSFFALVPYEQILNGVFESY